LLAYDKSVASREAAAELMEWKLNREVQVDVVSVVENPYVYLGEGYMAEPITVTPHQIAVVSETAERMASQIAEHFPHTRSHAPVANHVGEAIVKASENTHADLVVVGDTGHSMLGALLLGSTSRYVLHQAQCSVLISRHHWKASATAKEIVDATAAT
jgi:nucleotide-binding universal stress UspA family protein